MLIHNNPGVTVNSISLIHSVFCMHHCTAALFSAVLTHCAQYEVLEGYVLQFSDTASV